MIEMGSPEAVHGSTRGGSAHHPTGTANPDQDAYTPATGGPDQEVRSSQTFTTNSEGHDHGYRQTLGSDSMADHLGSGKSTLHRDERTTAPTQSLRTLESGSSMLHELCGHWFGVER